MAIKTFTESRLTQLCNVGWVGAAFDRPAQLPFFAQDRPTGIGIALHRGRGEHLGGREVENGGRCATTDHGRSSTWSPERPGPRQMCARLPHEVLVLEYSECRSVFKKDYRCMPLKFGPSLDPGGIQSQLFPKTLRQYEYPSI